MNFCQNCGDAIGEKSRYCKSCGNFLKPMEKFSIEEGSAKFCNHCGGAVGKQYCPSCGSYGKEIKLKTGGLNMGKLFGTVPAPNKQTNGAMRIKKEENANSVKALFTSLFSIQEDLKVTALNAGLFAIMLTFIIGAIVFVTNASIINEILNRIQKPAPNLDLLEIKEFKKVVDFKVFLWSVLTGTTLNGTLTDGLNIDIHLGMALPFLGLPILILLVMCIEFIRKIILKNERTFYMSVMQSGIFAIFSAILTIVFSYKQTYTISQTKASWEKVSDLIGKFVSLNDKIVFSVTSNMFSVFFTTFFITLLILLIMPGLKVENSIWKEIRRTVTIFIGVIACMTVIPGVVSAIICVSKIPALNFGTGVLLFVLATGMYSISIFTGNTEWCDFKATLPDFTNYMNMGNNALIINAKTTWTKFFFSFTNSEFSASDNGVSSSMPFATLHVCLIIIGIIAALYLSVKLWEKISCDWAIAAVISLVIGSGCSVLSLMLHRLFHLGAEIEFSTGIMRAYAGNVSTISSFFKETIVIAVLCMIGYAIWHFAGNIIGEFLVVKTHWVALGVCVCSLVLSIGIVSSIKLRSFRPVAENVVTVTYDGEYMNPVTKSEYIQKTVDTIMTKIDTALRLPDMF